MVVNILNGIKNLSEDETFYASLMKTDLMTKLTKIISNQMSNFASQGSTEQKILATVFELCTFLSESTPREYIQIWQEVFETGVSIIRST